MMNLRLLLATLSLSLVSLPCFGATELDLLRQRRAELDKQIRELEKQEQQQQPAQPAATGGTYTVKKGDSLELIARKTGNSRTTIASANGIKTTTMLHPGQVLKLSGGTAAPATAQALAAAETTAPASSSKYTVKQGETFYSIAKKHGVSTKSLISANPGVKVSALRPGQKLTILEKPAAVAATIAPTPASKTVLAENKSTPPVLSPGALAAKAQAEAFIPVSASIPAPPPPAVVREKRSPAKPITIEGEMTYGQFAQKHGTNPARLNELNGLDLNDSTLLAKGSELYIPAQP